MGEKGRAQRERVLEAALDVMAERGLAATRISDVAELEDRWMGLLADVVRSGVQAGVFHCGDVEAAVTQLYAAINGFAVQVVTGLGGLDRGGALEACLHLADVELDAQRLPSR